MLSPKYPHNHTCTNTLLTCKNSHTDARPTHHTHTQLGHGFYSEKRLKGWDWSVIPSHRPFAVPRREKRRFPLL